MAELEAAEATASGLATELAARAAVERERREVHEAARTALTGLQLRDGRLVADLEALERDRVRLHDERAAADAEAVQQRRAMAAPVPDRDLDLEAAVADAERELADAQRELGSLRTADRARGEELAALRRAEAARQAETETARRQLADAERRHAEAATTADATETRRAEAVALLDTLGPRSRTAQAAEVAAATARETARLALETAEAERASAAERCRDAAAAGAALRGRLEVLAERLAEDERRPIAKAARQAGGRRLDEDLAVDPGLRAAVEAALADRVRAYLVPSARVAGLAGERGQLVVEERATASAGDPEKLDAAERRCIDAVATAGGGRLGDAVRRDPTDGIRRLLARSVWLPDLAACLAVQAALPPGWIAVPRDGSAVVDDLTVTLGAPESILERRAEHARLAAEVERVDAELAVLRERGSLPPRLARPRHARTWNRRAARRRRPPASAVARRKRNAPRHGMSRRSRARPRGTSPQTQRIATEVSRFREAVAAMTTPASSGADRAGRTRPRPTPVGDGARGHGDRHRGLGASSRRAA